MSTNASENSAGAAADQGKDKVDARVEPSGLGQSVSLADRQEFFGREQTGKNKGSAIDKEGTIDFGDPVDLFKDGSTFDKSVLFGKLVKQPLTGEPVSISLPAGEQQPLDKARIAQLNEYLQETAALEDQDAREKEQSGRRDFEQSVDRFSEQRYQEHSLTGPAERFSQELSKKGTEEGGVVGIAKDAAGLLMNGVLEFSGIPDLEKSILKISADTLKGMPEEQLEMDRLKFGLATASFMPGLGLLKKAELTTEAAGKIVSKSPLAEAAENKLLSAYKSIADHVDDGARELGTMDAAARHKAPGVGSLDSAKVGSRVAEDVPAWQTRFRYDKMPDEFPAVGDGKDTYIYLRKDQIDQILEKGSLDGTAKGRAFGTDSPDIKDDLLSQVKTGVSDLKDRPYRIKVTGDAANYFSDITPTGPVTGYKAAMHQRTSVAPGYDFKFDPEKIKVSEDGFNIEISQGSLRKMPPDRYARAVAKDTESLVSNLAGDALIAGAVADVASGSALSARALDALLDEHGKPVRP